MPSTPVDSAAVNINDILGVLLICLILAAYLFGMSSSQMYIYYDRFPKDPWGLKILVCVVWLLDALHTALMSHTTYYYAVSNFADYGALAGKPVFSFNLEIVVVPILAFIVQSYFAYRAFANDSRQWPLCAGIEVLTLTQLVLGIIACVIAFAKFDGFFDLKSHTWALIAWMATSGAANVLVAGSLIYSFSANSASFTEEDGLLSKFLMYGVYTGLFTTIVTFIDLGFVTAWPQCLAFIGLTYILGKLYTNTLFYAINRRPVADPSYQSSSRGNKSKVHTGSSYPSGAANPYSLGSPRVNPKDPYAASQGVTFENQKPYPLTDLEAAADQNAQELDLTPDHQSEFSYAPKEKDYIVSESPTRAQQDVEASDY